MSAPTNESVFDRDDVTILTSVDGERIALHDFGGPANRDDGDNADSGDNPPLLLCHGNGLNAGMWAGALPWLTERFHCYGLDLRGHGRARPVDEDYSVARTRFADDIVTAIDTIGGPVHYAAHSLGAATAVWAARDHASPTDLFTGLWLFEPVLIPDHFLVDRNDRDEGPGLLVELSRKRRMEFDSTADAVARFRSKPPYSLCDERAVHGYVEIGTYPTEQGVRLSCRGEDEARVFESGEAMDFDTLAAIDLPALVVSGAATDKANALPPRVAPLVAEAMGNGRWVEFDDMSHFGPMEQPETMAGSIIEFFG